MDFSNVKILRNRYFWYLLTGIAIISLFARYYYFLLETKPLCPPNLKERIEEIIDFVDLPNANTKNDPFLKASFKKLPTYKTIIYMEEKEAESFVLTDLGIQILKMEKRFFKINHEIVNSDTIYHVELKTLSLDVHRFLAIFLLQNWYPQKAFLRLYYLSRNTSSFDCSTFSSLVTQMISWSHKARDFQRGIGNIDDIEVERQYLVIHNRVMDFLNAMNK